MTRKNSYPFPPQEELVRIKKKLSNPKYEGGNIALLKDADISEKVKYNLCQSILAYHQESKKSLAAMVKEIGIGITEKKLYDICRGKTTDFCLGELVIYANNLGITFIPCFKCGINIFPSLLKEVISSLKEQENSLMKGLNIYPTLERHHTLTR